VSSRQVPVRIIGRLIELSLTSDLATEARIKSSFGDKYVMEKEIIIVGGGGIESLEG